MDGYLKVGLLALVVVLPTACTAVVTEGPVVALGAQLSVERFLQASNEYDVRSMGRLFGTSDGSAMETGGPLGCAFKKIGSWFGGLPCVQRSEVEIRMEAIAQILQHSDYQVVGEQESRGSHFAREARVGEHDDATRCLDKGGAVRSGAD